MRTQQDAGFTLIEILVAAALLGIIALISSRFMNQAERERLQAKARSATMESNHRLMDLLERDIRFRLSNTAITVATDQRSIEITRRQAIDPNALNEMNDFYRVRYETRCLNKSARLAKFEPLPVQLASNRLQRFGACLKRVACGDTQLPAVFISIVGTGRIPPYPNPRFPSDLPAQGPVGTLPLGTALCVVQGADQVRITLDSLHTFGNELYQVVSQDKSIAIGSGDVQLLPHEL